MRCSKCGRVKKEEVICLIRDGSLMEVKKLKAIKKIYCMYCDKKEEEK